jgi:hypothetical protein
VKSNPGGRFGVGIGGTPRDEYDLVMTGSGPVKHRDSRDGTPSSRIAGW